MPAAVDTAEDFNEVGFHSEGSERPRAAYACKRVAIATFCF
jgi:hypothetical protein